MMLPVCSSVPSCSSLCPVSFQSAPRTLLPLRKLVEDKPVENGNLFCMQDGAHSLGTSLNTKDYSPVLSFVSEGSDKSCSLDSSILSPFPNDNDDIVAGFHNKYFDSQGNSGFPGRELFELHPVAISSESFSSVVDQMTAPTVASEVVATTEIVASTSPSYSVVFDASDDSISGSIASEGMSTAAEDSFSGFVNSISKSVFQAEDTLTEAYDELRLSVYKAINDIKKSFGGSIEELLSSVDTTKERANNGLNSFSNMFQVNVSSADALNALRRAILSVEGSVANTASFVVTKYETAKSVLPANVKDILSLTEEKVSEILRPVGYTFQQIYIIIERFEMNIGLDSNDPVIQLVLFLGGSVAAGVSYWFFTYGGYAGDLEPELTFELLKNDKNALLVDVRSEDVRERDGVPDLRSTARSKYACVLSPEIDDSIKKMLKGGQEFDDALLAVVISNLKTFKNDSKVIIMDVNGSRSKSIARSLKKLGVKRPYLLKGGFQSWAKSELRIKELKPETALTILNEEAEAILEIIKPTPTLIIGYSLGLAAVTYAFLEWETTLQLIGIFGLGLTVFWRLSSYETSEDLTKDVRLLLTPVSMGAQALSWAARKVDPNKVGLPTAPSTTAVHDRVLQAAAKHESQPSDETETSNPSGENLASGTTP